MKRVVFLILFSLIISIAYAGDSVKMKASDIKYKVILKDGKDFKSFAGNQRIYLFTEYARLKFNFFQIDSVQIGIIPDYRNEKKIVSLMQKLKSADAELKKSSFERICKLNINALPVIRNYIDNNDYKSNKDKADEYGAELAYEILIKKYGVDRNFLDRDVLFMNEGFKLGGILSVKKHRVLLKFGKLILPREDIRKIVILH